MFVNLQKREKEIKRPEIELSAQYIRLLYLAFYGRLLHLWLRISVISLPREGPGGLRRECVLRIPSML